MLNKLKQGGGSLLDRMRGREEEKSDPLTRTIRDRWVLRSEKVWWEGSSWQASRQKGDETNHLLPETNRYQSTLAGGLHCLLFVHVTTDTLLLAPLLMVQILRTGGPDFQEFLRAILTADITSGTLFSFSGTHFWLQDSSGTQLAQNHFWS